ncbi:glycosyltransferase [Terriglobus saanensis]|uniref:Glycosyl transferase family 2 n=1 Tax=Terriglobus saanensis (strain ATCC BAA-1853 / DSM 23119 / SP1PR4) TaxID=401053 RepID=E8V5R9_TERSS|nr:glycosyltransferase [Terriglobus saanensis]ADV82678.1 glycosyl transferase family 2 [Terriglobus saanensis SP1PR4]
MSEPCELSIVMPAYREAESLKTLLPVLVLAARALSPDVEIIVSDARLPLDDTAEVCSVHGVRHLHRTGGDTYGDAVRSGITASKGTFVILMDSDGSHNPKELFKLWAKRESYDIVIGSRYIKGGNTENPAILIFMSRMLNHAYRLAFKLNVYDVSNSLRLYKGAQLRPLRLVSDNFDIVEEILIRLIYGVSKATVTEVPVTFEQRKAGESKRNLPKFLLSYLSSMKKMQSFRAEETARDKGV